MFIYSPVSEISNLYIKRLPPGRPVNITKAVRVDSFCLMLGENGTLYHDGRHKDYAYLLGEYPWSLSMMKALKRLGVITKNQLDQHMKAAKAEDERKDKGWDMKLLTKMSEKHGFKASKEQQRKLAQ
ncbi:MAG: hypothetical protein AAF098_13425 [Pseudomonadota bacterium]